MTITLLYSHTCHHSEFPGNWTWVSMFPSVVSNIGLLRFFLRFFGF